MPVDEFVTERPEVATRIALFDQSTKFRIDRQQVLKGSVLFAGLSDDETPVLLLDSRLDLPHVAVNELRHVALSPEDCGARLDDAARAQRVSFARPPKRRFGSLVALEEGTRRPLGRRRWAIGNSCVDGLKPLPAELSDFLDDGFEELGHGWLL